VEVTFPEEKEIVGVRTSSMQLPIVFDYHEWREFIAGVKRGEYDI